MDRVAYPCPCIACHICLVHSHSRMYGTILYEIDFYFQLQKNTHATNKTIGAAAAAAAAAAEINGK